MRFQTTYRSPAKIAYVQVRLEQQELQIRYCVLGKKQAKLPELIAAGDKEALVAKIGKGVPYVLHFQGFGVLTRNVERVPNFRDTLLVNGDETDFYFNAMPFARTVAVSFLRTSLVAEFMEYLAARKVFVWDLHIGPVPLAATLGKDTSAELDFRIVLANGDLRTLERNTGEVKRLPAPDGFLSADEAYVRAARDITWCRPEEYEDGLSEEFREATRSSYKEFVRFVRLGVGILAFFLLTLTANYFYVNHLNTVAAGLESEIAGYGDNLSMIDRLEQEKARKTVLAENSGIQSSRYLSFYLDELGASVPKDVQLEILETFPLAEPLKPKRKVELNTAHISIAGFSGSSKVLDDWMEDLEGKPWIAGVELMQYVRIHERKASFTLLVKILP